MQFSAPITESQINSITSITITQHRGEDKQVFAAIANRPDGMILGKAVHNRAEFGEDPDQLTSRMFIEFVPGLAWLKHKCLEYIGRTDVDFLVVEGDPIIQQPGLGPARQSLTRRQ